MEPCRGTGIWPAGVARYFEDGHGLALGFSRRVCYGPAPTPQRVLRFSVVLLSPRGFRYSGARSGLSPCRGMELVMAVSSDMRFVEALTFDDVLLKPGPSEVMPSDADVRTRLTREIS